MDDRLAYTIPEVADLCGVTVAAVKAWVSRGDLPAVRLGGVKVPGRPGRPPGQVVVPADALREVLTPTK